MKGPRPPSGAPPPKGLVEVSTLRGPRPPSAAYPGDQTFVAPKTSAPYKTEDDEEMPQGLINKVKHIWHKKVQEKKFTNRALVCALAVSLLWASSLGVCRLIVKGFIPSPTYDELEAAVVQLSDTIESESDNYVSCVDLAFALCTTRYENERDAELARVESLQNINFANLTDQQAIRDDCAQKHDQLMSILSTLRTNGSAANSTALIVANFYFPSNPPECLDLDVLSVNQLKAAAATAIAEQTANASATAIDNFTAQLDARVAYDLEYLGLTLPDLFENANLDIRGPNLPSATDLGLGFNASFDFFEACTTGKGTAGSAICSDPFLVLQDMEVSLGDFQDDYETLKLRAEAMIAEIEGYQETFDDIVGQAQNILGAVGVSFEGQIFGSLSGPPWEFPEVNYGGIQADFLQTDFLDSVGIDPEALEQLIQEQQDALAAAMADAAEQLQAVDLEMAQLQLDFNAKLLEDYNPPPLTYNETNEEQAEAQASIGERIAAELGFVPTDSDDASRVDRVVSVANQTAANFLQAIKEREFEFFEYPASFFTDFQVGLDDIERYAILFDILWRCLQSAFLIRKYWSISGIGTPPADVRAQSVALYKQKRNIFQMAAYVLTHPLVQLLQIIIWIAIITTVLYVAYDPLYTEYQNGCILNDAEDISVQELDDGTMFYRNGLSVTGNAAYKDGDKRITESISELNLEREFSCRENLDSSVEQRDLQAAAYFSFDNDQELLISRFDLFQTCVDWDSIDTNYDVNTEFGVSLEDLVITPQCHASLTPIDLSDDLLHQCANIEACTHTCEGIDPVQLRAVNHRAACTTEWAGHAYMLGIVFSVAIYILLNVSRLYFMRGIVAIWWKQITVDKYSYLGSCTKLGSILYPKEVLEEGQEFHKVIKDKLDVALKNFSFYGYFELAFAVALNMPWFIFLIIFGNSLRYEA
mmetsp:Transcript_17724/g.23203  ORF Transcript_17724/g.23203 Transcript_17724/m.23203 type:complete len:932 (-) Transcript_17724:208-3003(-)